MNVLLSTPQTLVVALLALPLGALAQDQCTAPSEVVDEATRLTEALARAELSAEEYAGQYEALLPDQCGPVPVPNHIVLLEKLASPRKSTSTLPPTTQDPVPVDASASSALRQLVAARAVAKAGRPASHRKIQTRLLHLAAASSSYDSVRPDVALDQAGRIAVIVHGSVEDLVNLVPDSPDRARRVYPSKGAVTALLSPSEILALAETPAVVRVRAATAPVLHMADVSEGDHAHRADLARATWNMDGTGTTVGVISNGVDSLAAAQATGDLPGASQLTVLAGLAGNGDEGTAMLEVVHDLALVPPSYLPPMAPTNSPIKHPSTP